MKFAATGALLGTIPALAARGIKNTGSVRLRNGPVVTAGGLIFVGSNGDGYIHAFDKETGKVLWKSQVEANPDGIPAVYEVGGREYVAFYGAAGGTESSSDRPNRKRKVTMSSPSLIQVRGRRKTANEHVQQLT
jgi:quinoprotein glucose dehydrogenase